MSVTLRLATRKSALALAQARDAAVQLQARSPGLSIQELHVVTSGDRFRDQPLQDLGGKGLFIKEIELALLERRADLAVHSMKDVPAELAPGLRIAAIAVRADPRDVLVSRSGATLAGLPPGARVGTSSLRRRTQLLSLRADLEVVPLRGNVDTRLRKTDEGIVDAVVLALAGLQRLGLTARATEILDPQVFVPAVGQGAIGIECRDDDPAVEAVVRRLDHEPTSVCVAAERAFMAAVEGSCRLPVAAHCVREQDELRIACLLADEDGARVRRAERRTAWTTDVTEAVQLGQEIGRELRAG